MLIRVFKKEKPIFLLTFYEILLSKIVTIITFSLNFFNLFLFSFYFKFCVASLQFFLVILYF